jgi:hypothetical protein
MTSLVPRYSLVSDIRYLAQPGKTGEVSRWLDASQSRELLVLWPFVCRTNGC